jgi:hypothetical protein
MPNNVVKSYSTKSGKSVEEIEALWKKIEKEADEKFGKKDKHYWAYVNGTVKKILRLNECIRIPFSEFLLMQNNSRENLDATQMNQSEKRQVS